MINIKQQITDKRFQPLKDVAIFAILILGFHYFFRYWAYKLGYWPINEFVQPAYKFLSHLLYENSVWVLDHFTSLEFTKNDSLNTIYANDGFVGINAGCSGLKQFLQWIVLMVFFPGPWKHKAWFIPAGLIIVHLVNIFRISTLAILLTFNISQSNWDFTHDYILRPFFYVVMFGMWVFWVEKFVGRCENLEMRS